MDFKIERIVALQDEEINSKIIKLIIDYGILYSKLQNIERQSWYFKRGIDGNRKKLKLINTDFEKIRNDVNNYTINKLIKEVNKEKEVERSFGSRKEYCNLTSRIFSAWVHKAAINRIYYLTKLIQIKKEIGILESIDFYLVNYKNLIKLISTIKSDETSHLNITT